MARTGIVPEVVGVADSKFRRTSSYAVTSPSLFTNGIGVGPAERRGIRRRTRTSVRQETSTQ